MKHNLTCNEVVSITEISCKINNKRVAFMPGKYSNTRPSSGYSSLNAVPSKANIAKQTGKKLEKIKTSKNRNRVNETVTLSMRYEWQKEYFK